jgi:hypothetical protein
MWIFAYSALEAGVGYIAVGERGIAGGQDDQDFRYCGA